MSDVVTPTALPDLSALAFDAESCGTCTAGRFAKVGDPVGVCRRNQPTALISKYVVAQMPDGNTVMQALHADGYFPPVRSDWKCRDGYERRGKFSLSIDSPTEGGSQ